MELTLGFMVVVDELRYCDASSSTSAIRLRRLTARRDIHKCLSTTVNQFLVFIATFMPRCVEYH